MALPDDFRTESRERWSARAEGWEARRDQWRTQTLPVSAWMIDAVDPQPGQTLLELAAGTGDTGLLAAELVAPGGTVILSDFAPAMLAAAHRRAEELGIGNVRFKQIDAETNIDVAAASLDGVLCRWGLMLLADPESALRDVRRVLKPGGRLALAAWTGPDENPWSVLPMREALARGLAERPAADAPGQFAWSGEGVVAEQLEAAGFADLHVERLEFPMHFASVDEWWGTQADMSGGFAKALAQAADEDRAAVRAAVERHAEAFAGPDGALTLPAATWVAWAAA